MVARLISFASCLHHRIRLSKRPVLVSVSTLSCRCEYDLIKCWRKTFYRLISFVVPSAVQMHLLKLPDETLLHIFKITYSEPHLTFSEDWRTIISDASHKIVRKWSPRLKALSEVNSRLRRIALPFLVRSIYIESDEKLLAFASDLLSGEDYGLVSLSKLLIVRRGFADNETLSSSYALNRTLGFASNITTLHIPYPTYIDGPFLRVLASCHRLHTLWLACIGPRETHDDFSFLKTISLRWAYFWMFGNTSAEPIKALLSGDTRHTLRFLQLNLTEQCDIFSEDTSYDALRVLKLKGATPRNFDPLAFSRIFPNLLTLATVCDIPWGLSNLPGWLRSTSTIRRLSLKSCSQGVERALGSMSLLEELSITNAMNGVEFKSVCEALHDMTELRSVTLRRSVQGGPIVINDVLLLVSSAPSLQNLSLICGDELNRTNWRCSIGELAAALARTSIELHNTLTVSDISCFRLQVPETSALERTC